MNADVSRGGIGHHFWDDERANAARPAALHEFGVLFFVFGEAANAAADDGAAPKGIFPAEVNAAFLPGIVGSDHGEL